MKDKINKELEDLGWASMQSLLDKEMPKEGALFIENTEGGDASSTAINVPDTQGSESKKKWLWLLLLLCFVGCGIASLQLLKERVGQDAENCMPPIAQNDKIEVDISSSETDFEKHGNLGNSIKSPSIDAEISSDKSLLKQDKKAFKNKKIEKNIGNSIVNNIPQNVENQLFEKDFMPILNNEKLGKEVENTPLKNVIKDSDNSAFNDIEKTNENLNTALKVPFNAFSTLDKIALLDSFNVKNKVFNIPILTSMKSIKKASKIEWGVTAGAHSILKTSNNSLFNGFQLGGVASKPISNDWSIYTGITFRSTLANGDSLTYIKADTSAQSNKSTSTSPSTFNLTNGTPVRLNRLRYIEIPLLLTCKINEKWFFSSGMKASYLISKNFTTPYNPNVYVINGSSNAFDRNSNNILYNNSSNESLGLKRWDFALMGALNYRISPHFNVSARYDFGLNNIFKKPNWVAYNRYLGVNVGYIF